VRKAANVTARAIAIRLGLFAFIAWMGLFLVFPLILYPLAGALAAAALSVFGAAVAANAVSIRVFERSGLEACGLDWRPTSARELLLGMGLGGAFASLVILIPLAGGQARFAAAEAPEHPWSTVAFVAFILLFGAAGEEMLFHGYGFQLLARKAGNFAAILPVAALFGWVHTGNEGSNALGIVNTAAWGAILGYAWVRTQALWLPIGLHFGWNLALPLLGAKLSGFTMGVAGYTLTWSGNVLWSGGEYGPEGGVLTTAAVVTLAVVLPRLFKEVEQLCPEPPESPSS
jgi:hypothetical protein